MDWLNLLWLVPVLSFGILEAWALMNPRDKFEPLTTWIRKVFQLHNPWQPLYWVAAGLLVWLAIHFLIDSVVRRRR